MYNFFALLSRMKYIKRWSLMNNTIQENIMEHSQQVTTFAHALAIINNKIFGGDVDANQVAVYAMYHDTSEVLTGDLPTPVKYYNDRIVSAYKELENIANNKLLSMLPQELRDEFRQNIEVDEASYEYKLVKAADRLSAYCKCLEELKSGNQEFKQARETIFNKLTASTLPEVKYFMDNFIEGFSSTLDIAIMQELL